KQLLITIGLPFVDGVHEAEAECAALEGLKICQATISDDSDTFLFGSKCVIRNFFDNKRNIEVYTLSNIKRLTSFNNQLDMIGFASLTGSDYFIGIYGIGRVTATQIIEVLPQDNFSSGKDFAQKIKDNLSIDHKLKQKIIDGFDFIDNDEIWQTYMYFYELQPNLSKFKEFS
ncbi:MAG: single-stranded DNA binding, variant 2, partial [Marteilia pararefringens]